MSGPSTATTSSSSALSTWFTQHRRAVLVAAASLTLLTAGSLYYASSAASTPKSSRDTATKATNKDKKARKAKGADKDRSSASSPSSGAADKATDVKPQDDDGQSRVFSLPRCCPGGLSRGLRRLSRDRPARSDPHLHDARPAPTGIVGAATWRCATPRRASLGRC